MTKNFFITISMLKIVVFSISSFAQSRLSQDKFYLCVFHRAKFSNNVMDTVYRTPLYEIDRSEFSFNEDGRYTFLNKSETERQYKDALSATKIQGPEDYITVWTKRNATEVPESIAFGVQRGMASYYYVKELKLPIDWRSRKVTKVATFNNNISEKPKKSSVTVEAGGDSGVKKAVARATLSQSQADAEDKVKAAAAKVAGRTADLELQRLLEIERQKRKARGNRQ